MVRQEAKLGNNIGRTEQNEHPTPEDVFEAFKTFGAQFQAEKERENSKLSFIEGSINDECNLSDRRLAKIIWIRNYEKYNLKTKFTIGWIILEGDLRQKGIRRIGYQFGRDSDGTGNSTPFIVKTILRDGESTFEGKVLNIGDGQEELKEVNTLIKELSAKFPPLPKKNKGSIFEPIKRVLKI